MGRPQFIALAAAAGGVLACSGLLGDDGPSFSEEAKLDAGDEAEQARLRGDFAGAEAILRRRLEADPDDPRAWRLLGDVNFTRGQRFVQKWKENLGWAVDAYTRAVEIDPTSCLAWGRLAATVVAAGENETTQVPRERLDALPLDAGWQSCPGATLLELELRRVPSADEVGAVRRKLSWDAAEAEVLATAAPWMRDAVGRVDLSGMEWREVLPRPEVGGDTHYVVLKTPVVAQSVENSKPRSFTYPEWLRIIRVAGGRIVYLDRRFPERVPSTGVTRATGCPGTTWTLEGPDRVAVGKCVAGAHDGRASEVYEPALLRPAGAAHYHHPSIAPATIGWIDIAEQSVSCLGGPVGRMFVDVPSCQVSYDRAIPQKRSIPVDVGLTAWSEEHARRMVDAARSAPLFGEALADKLARGQLGAGLPYGMFVWTQPDLTGCKGRGIYNKAQIVDGAIEFTCTLGELTVSFRELTVVDVRIGK